MEVGSLCPVSGFDSIKLMCYTQKTNRKHRWATDFATGIGRDQQVDMKNPTTAVVAQKPLTESQWVSRIPPWTVST